MSPIAKIKEKSKDCPQKITVTLANLEEEDDEKKKTTLMEQI